MSAKRHLQKSSTGFGMVEVLVATVLLSVGLLGLIGLQLTAMRNTQSAQLRSQASLLAYDIAERMRANRNAALSGSYNTALADPAPSTPSSLRDQDIAAWKNALASLLPDGQGALDTTTSSPGTVRVTIRWNDSHAMQDTNAQQWIADVQP